MRISDWSSDVCSSDLPMPDEARAILVQAAAARTDERALVLRVAAEAGALARDVAPDEQLCAVGRDFEAGDLGLGAGDLRCGGVCLRIDAPYLVDRKSTRLNSSH